MLSWVEHEKKLYNLGACFILSIGYSVQHRLQIQYCLFRPNTPQLSLKHPKTHKMEWTLSLWHGVGTLKEIISLTD